MKFLKAVKEDAAVLAEIALNAAYAAKWSKADFEHSFSNASCDIFKLCDDGQTAGFICYSGAADFKELVNFAVRKEFLRRGFGKKLLEESLFFLANRGIKEVTLEVSINNKAAVSLYIKNGFEEKGRRKQFYENKDDALIMGKLL